MLLATRRRKSAAFMPKTKPGARRRGYPCLCVPQFSDDECRHRGERMDLNDWRLVEERLYGHQPTIGGPNGTNTIHSHID
jgi:hypothetical protein